MGSQQAKLPSPCYLKLVAFQNVFYNMLAFLFTADQNFSYRFSDAKKAMLLKKKHLTGLCLLQTKNISFGEILEKSFHFKLMIDFI